MRGRSSLSGKVGFRSFGQCQGGSISAFPLGGAFGERGTRGQGCEAPAVGARVVRVLDARRRLESRPARQDPALDRLATSASTAAAISDLVGQTVSRLREGLSLRTDSYIRSSGANLGAIVVGNGGLTGVHTVLKPGPDDDFQWPIGIDAPHKPFPHDRWDTDRDEDHCRGQSSRSSPTN